ncbi:RhoGAP domain-containing protein [Tieghemostelium lacteum]|uniref:RhoGAP domain-containing protein n=1 Tax=Tieghemostelium lacteum TaxID=361077 RepID=A0A152A5A3_TIELA|nr:RhoGAP domain-containing protein [Tieghemostelium lacteum]|eukprot:KYR01413.1 RhoGAP domain-containing protein [Tieghemostelium lacteum]
MQFSKKIKKSISITKQNLMEKTSNRENTLEPEEMKLLEKQISESKGNLRKLTKSIQKETLSSGVSIQDGTELSNNFIDYSVFLRENYPDLVILSGVLSKIGEFQAGFEDLKAKLNTSLINEVSNPLKSLTKTELVQAQNQKKEYDKVRVSYDASLSELSQLKKKKDTKPQKIQEQEIECETMKQKFENAGQETTSVLQDTNVISEFETIEKLCDYLDSYHTFFTKGYRWLAQMIPDIYEYRLYVEKRKAELEKSKVRMSMMLSPTKGAQEALKNKVFGEDLSVLLQKDQSAIPRFIIRAFHSIRNHITEEGLFRLSGTKRIIMEVKKNIDEGKEYNLDEITDVHVTCNLVKLFLRELQPEPLLTYSRYNDLIDVCNIEDPNGRVAKIQKVVQSLPKHYYNLLHHLMHLLYQISQTPKSKMGPANLATVVGPNILVSQHDVVVEDIALGNMVITTMIQNFEKIFNGAPQLVQEVFVQSTTSTSTLNTSFTTTATNSNGNFRSPSIDNSSDQHQIPIYSGVPMKNKHNDDDDCSTLGDSFDENEAVELSDD